MIPALHEKTKLRLARQLFGSRPHSTQALWLADDSKVKVVACGRRRRLLAMKDNASQVAKRH